MSREHPNNGHEALEAEEKNSQETVTNNCKLGLNNKAHFKKEVRRSDEALGLGDAVNHVRQDEDPSNPFMLRSDISIKAEIFNKYLHALALAIQESYLEGAQAERERILKFINENYKDFTNFDWSMIDYKLREITEGVR